MNPEVVDDTFASSIEDVNSVEWTDAWRLSDGTRIVLRPVQPQDSPLLSAMMARLSSQTKYNRFHGTVNNLTSTHLRYMSCVDQQRHVAFVLTTLQNGEEHIIADARYVVDENAADESAEFAIMVEDQWQRFGLAKHAMQALTTAASNNGLRWLHGDVLAENCPMLALMEQCHFCCTPDRSDEKMVHAEILLTAADHKSNTTSDTPNTFGHFLWQWLKSARSLIQQQPHGGRYA
jgi:RimJ/RimL family protein N-acetyltransferase